MLDPTVVSAIPGFRDLMSRRRRFGFSLAALMMVLYMGFFAVVAYAPAALRVPVDGFGSTGFLAVFAMFVVAWLMTWAYLRGIRRELLPLENAIRSDIRGAAARPGSAS